jgi:hypothetical protein
LKFGESFKGNIVQNLKQNTNVHLDLVQNEGCKKILTLLSNVSHIDDDQMLKVLKQIDKTTTMITNTL